MKALVLAFVAAAAAAAATAAPSGVATQTGVVTCARAIDQSARPDTGRGRTRLVLGRIWLPKPSFVIGLSAPRPGSDRFGKFGLEVLAGRPIVLSVPTRWRRAYSLVFAYGNVNRVADGDQLITVHSCAGAFGRWNGYAGGYEVRRPVCVPLTVRVGSRTATVRISVGRRCPTSG